MYVYTYIFICVYIYMKQRDIHIDIQILYTHENVYSLVRSKTSLCSHVGEMGSNVLKVCFVMLQKMFKG